MDLTCIANEIDSIIDAIMELGNGVTESDIVSEVPRLMEMRDRIYTIAEDEKRIYELNHEDLVNMLCGFPCTHKTAGFMSKNGFGNLYEYHGGFHDYYEWNRSAMVEMNDMEVYSLYLSLKAL